MTGVRPLTVLSGALGSGKTTLLRRLLREPGLAGTYVVVNEFGDIGIDHDQLRWVSERVSLLPGACVCCAIRDDLVDTLLELLADEAAGRLPPMRRVVVETTGLADPAPVVATLLTSPVLRHHFRVDRVVVTVDATTPAPQRSAEWLQQVICADTIAVTKDDLVTQEVVASLGEMLRSVNPAALVTLARDVQLDVEQPGIPVAADVEPLGDEHLAGVAAGSASFDGTVEWAAFAVWVSALLHAHGDRVLRLKAILDTGGAGPVVVDGVQHVTYPPRHLPSWRGSPRSQVVVITRELPPDRLLAALAEFVVRPG
ncbi:MAG: GTP-binding protein [Actinomycetota bacterium]|nr:GTP-binding protein [Actinomycetota bacterium]